MSKNYDNWERLVDAVLRRELIRRLCHQQSRTPSLQSSISSSDFSSSFRSTPSFSFNFSNPLFRYGPPLPFQTVAGVKTRFKLTTNENLVLFEDSLLAFGLEELLMAPCSVLGDELKSFSSVYVVSFKEDVNVVVVRYRRSGNASPEVLNRKWKTIQSLKHENVVGLRGYYNDKDGTFGFYDYFHQGSLHSMLHGKIWMNQVDLDWEARIRIAIGAAKGLLHIHGEQGGIFVHGSVMASNVFFNSQKYGCVDVRPDYHISFRNRMCHAPEVYIKKQASQAGDVYSFGVLLVELVSGKLSPLHYAGTHKTFADWGLYNACDELTTMVFDRELLNDPIAAQAMREMLGVASLCVRKNPQERPDMNDVVHMLENNL